MTIAFRVDAAPEIGNGHGLRCLALANQCAAIGLKIVFVVRRLTRDVEKAMFDAGHEVVFLNQTVPFYEPDNDSRPAQSDGYASWLGVSCEHDAQETGQFLRTRSDIVGLFLDHYALDANWSRYVRAQCNLRHIFVIDDLANRAHDCDILIDANFYANFENRYDDLIPSHAQKLLGPRYTMLRPEFAAFRAKTLPPSPDHDRLVISLGGVDHDNVTAAVLQALTLLAPFEQVDVIIGDAHPSKSALERECQQKGYRFHVNTSQIARIFSEATLAIGAGGTTTWERMCLGLPTLALCVADNQNRMLDDTDRAGLLLRYKGDIGSPNQIAAALGSLRKNKKLRKEMTKRGRDLVDGAGLERIGRAVQTMLEKDK